MWNIIEVSQYGIQEDDLNMSLGATVKMTLNFTDNLKKYDTVFDPLKFEDFIGSLDVEFDPCEPQLFFFSTSEGLFKIDKRQ